MKTASFSIFDSKANIYMPPFNSANTETAIREFKHLINTSQGHFHNYPEDYSLFHRGYDDDTSGLHEKLQTPVHLANAVTLVEGSQTYAEAALERVESVKQANPAPEFQAPSASAGYRHQTRETTK